jgi:hypothetical protein
VLAGVTSRFFGVQTALFGRLRERHILPVHPKHTATVHGTLEAAQRTVNVFFVADFDSYSYLMRCQDIPSFKGGCSGFSKAPQYTPWGPSITTVIN